MPVANPNGYPLNGSGIVSLQFSSTATIQAAGAAVAWRLYRLNSIWDPDFSGGGQPMYHDQLQTLYNHYQVIGTKVSLRICAHPTNATTEYPIRVAYFVRDSNTDPTSMAQEIENGRCKTALITSSENSYQLVSKWSAKKFFGPERANDEATGALFGASPSELAWGFFMIQSGNAGATGPKVYADIKMEFIVKVGEPKKLARS